MHTDLGRAATIAESQAELRANWDGPRCPHGRPAGMILGWDDPCGACEQEAGQLAAHEDYLAEIDATGSYGFPIGPDRPACWREDAHVRLGYADRTDGTADDLPF